MEAPCSVCRRVAAKFSCSCAIPAVLICAGCAGVHLETEGLHMPTPLNKKAAAPAQVQGNEVCDGCRAKPAVRLCLCTTPVRKYCEDCDIAHFRKAPLLTHSEHPISAYAAVASNRIPLEAFKRKQLFINDFQLRLTQELTNFDAFVNQVGEKFDQLIAFATTKKEALLRDLQVQRGKLARLLNDAKQEIEAKRYAEAFEVKTYLDGVILNGYTASSMPEVKMFEGKVDVERVSELLEKAVTYDIVGDIKSVFASKVGTQPQEIPVIKGNSLRLFHLQTLQMTQTTLNQSTQIDNCTAYCFIKADSLLCCGGGAHSEAYEINVRTRNVERVANMSTVRRYPGIWKYRNGFVYIFGGNNNSAEKYSLTSKSWQNVRGTLYTAKYLCSVCEHSANLYISGIYLPNNGSSIDCFNPENETFSLLRSDSIYASILCCEGNSLYCVRNTTIEEANLSNGPAAATFVTKANIPSIGGHYWLSCPMPWLAGELTSVLNCAGNIGGLFRFSPAKSQFTQVVTFTY